MSVLHITSGKIMRGAENQVFLQIESLSKIDGWRQAGVFSKGSEICRKSKKYCGVLCGRLSLFNIIFAFKVASKFPRKDYRIIHANCSKSLSFAILLKFIRGGEIVMSRRTVHPIKSAWKYKFVTSCIACSNAVKNELGVVVNKKIEVIYDSVPPSFKGEKDQVEKCFGKRTVLSGAALTSEKGLFGLLDAWKLLKERHGLPHELLIAGEGPLRSSLLSYIEDRGVSNVHLLGWVLNIKEYIVAAEVCVLSSSSEGLGSFLCEAAYVGKPLCGTKVGGIPEVITHGVNGYLHGVGETEEFAENMAKILTNKNLREEMSNASKKQASKRFSLRKNAERTLQVYRSVGGA